MIGWLGCTYIGSVRPRPTPGHARTDGQTTARCSRRPVACLRSFQFLENNRTPTLAFGSDKHPVGDPRPAHTECGRGVRGRAIPPCQAAWRHKCPRFGRGCGRVPHRRMGWQASTGWGNGVPRPPTPEHVRLYGNYGGWVIRPSVRPNPTRATRGFQL